MLSCSGCGTAIADANVARSIGAARCGNCGTLVDLRRSLAAAPKTAIVAAPTRWKLEELPGKFTASWNWFTPTRIFLIPFTLFWNGILSVFAFTATDGFQYPERLFFGLLIPHVWVGIGLFWTCLTSFTNRTTVRAGDGTLEVRHHPLWWPGNRKLPREDVTQLFVLEQRRKGGPTYQVCAVLRDGRKQVLLGGLASDEASFLERALEHALHLENRPVEGEHRAVATGAAAR